jgi:rhamnogalacturonan endolyase
MVTLRRAVWAIAVVALVFVGRTNAARHVEKLGRGVVAMATNDGNVYIGWRLLATDARDVEFNVLRCAEPNGPREKLNAVPIRDSCNFVDSKAGGKSWHYVVQPVGSAAESSPVRSDPADAQRRCLTIPLQGDYGANKLAIADLDGDGVYDFIIKQPASSIDPGSPRRSRDTYKIEAYNGRTGRFMWRHDLGWNINAGIWFSPVVVYDLDCDGRAEVALKAAPYAATAEEAFISDNGRPGGTRVLLILDGLTGKETVRSIGSHGATSRTGATGPAIV